VLPREVQIQVAPPDERSCGMIIEGARAVDGDRTPRSKERSDAVVVRAGLPLKAIADLALKHRLPVATSLRQFFETGLESDLWHRSAIFVHKILQGGRSTDLPVE